MEQLDIELTPQEVKKEIRRKAVKAIIHAQVVLTQCYHEFWSRSKQEILDGMNEDVPSSLIEMRGNTALGTVINDQLARTSYEGRCIVVMPDGYDFVDGAFVYAEPVVVVPEPQPTPEPQPEPTPEPIPLPENIEL